MQQSKPFTVEVVDKITFTKDEARSIIELRPIKLFILPEGTKTNKMSFGILLATNDNTPVVIGQLSLAMLIDGLAEKGRQIIDEVLNAGI